MRGKLGKFLKQILKLLSESFGGVYRNTDISYICKDRVMWGAAGGLGPTQVFLHCRFFPGLLDYPAVAECLYLADTIFCYLCSTPYISEKLDAFNSLLQFAIDTFFPLRTYKKHPFNKLAGRSTNNPVSSIIMSGKEMCGTQLATHINQSFLLTTNSMHPIPELNNKLYIMDINRMKYQIPAEDVATICNASIQESLVPDIWKEANVIPIAKTNKIKEAEKDLRPISLTAILSKTLGHFVTEWILTQINHLIDLNSSELFGDYPQSMLLSPFSITSTAFLTNQTKA